MPERYQNPKTSPRHNIWFDPKRIFKAGQPFQTFVHSKGNVNILAGLIKKDINPRKCSAIEIGPGTMPFLRNLKPKKQVYVDISRLLTKQLKKSHNASGAHFITGDLLKLPRLPIQKGERFDLAVLAEVLTHVPPKSRQLAIKKIAAIADRVAIVDRAHAVIAYGEESAKTFSHKTDPTLVSPSETANALKALGFAVYRKDVNVEFPMRSDMERAVNYFIIYAKRKKPK